MQAPDDAPDRPMTAAPVEFGLGLRGLDRVGERARLAEKTGFDYVTCGEHLFFHGPTPNAFVTLAAAAEATSTAKLLSAVTLLPLYPPALAAKLATTLDVISGGRFVLGVGVGGEYPLEFEAASVPVEERGKRTDEALEVIGRLFTSSSVSFAGRWTSLSAVGLDPMPAQAGGPPIWVAGRSDASIRRAARFADTWMPYLVTPEQLRTGLAQLRELADQQGRDGAPVGASVYLFLAVAEDGERARRSAAAVVGGSYRQDFSRLGRYIVAGTPEECVSRLGEYVEAGARSIQIQLACQPDQDERSIQLLTQHVLPGMRAAGF
jgi:probable F420-dependent oxidoreductase